MHRYVTCSSCNCTIDKDVHDGWEDCTGCGHPACRHCRHSGCAVCKTKRDEYIFEARHLIPEPSGESVLPERMKY